MRMIGVAVVLAVGLILAPLAAEAQPAGKVWRIGVLSLARIPPVEDAFRQGLRERGYVEAGTSLWSGDSRRGETNASPTSRRSSFVSKLI